MEPMPGPESRGSGVSDPSTQYPRIWPPGPDAIWGLLFWEGVTTLVTCNQTLLSAVAEAREMRTGDPLGLTDRGMPPAQG
jgi:hypothetical protein